MMSSPEVATTLTVDIPFYVLTDPGFVFESYAINATVGTPPQNVVLMLDTLFGDSRINNVRIQVNNASFGGPTFNPMASQSFQSNIMTGNFTNSSLIAPIYANQPLGMNFTYGSDNIHIGGRPDLQIPNLPFMTSHNELFGSSLPVNNAAQSTATIWLDSAYGLGLGPLSYSAFKQENITALSNTSTPSFLQQVYDQNRTSSKSYSLWLDEGKQTGHLLLSGINTARFIPPLVPLRTEIYHVGAGSGFLLPTDMLVVNMSVVSLTSSSSQSIALPDISQSVSLGWQRTNAGFAPSVTKAIWDALKAEYTQALPGVFARVPCSYLSDTRTLDMVFEGSGMVLRAPVSELTSLLDPAFYPANSTNKCTLNILVQDPGSPSTLSTAMLRGLYRVFDVERGKVAVALTDFSGSREDKIVSVPAGGVETVSRDILEGKSSYSRINSLEFKVGLGVGIIIFLVLCLAVFLLLRKRNQSKQAPSPEYPPEKELDGEETKISELTTLDARFQVSEMDGRPPEAELMGKDAKFLVGEMEVKEVVHELP